MAVIYQIIVKPIQGLALFLNVGHQGVVVDRKEEKSLFYNPLTQRRCCVCNHSIDGIQLADLIQSGFVKIRRLAGPISVGAQGIVQPKRMIVRTVDSQITVQRNGTAHTQHHSTASRQHGIVGHGHETLMADAARSVEINGIVVVAPHHHQPTIRATQKFPVTLIDVIVVSRPFKAHSTIASHHNQGVP